MALIGRNQSIWRIVYPTATLLTTISTQTGPGIKLRASVVTNWLVMAEPRMCEACSEAGEAGTYETFL
jgi:hypothetical protein